MLDSRKYNKPMIAFVFIAVAVLCGCFYESLVPLAPINDKLFDEDLIGIWLQTDPVGSESPLKITVAQFRGPEYYIESIYETGTSNKGKPSRYRGYLTMVGKTMFINVQELKTGARPYSFFTIKKISEDTITIAGLIEDIAPRFETSNELFDFVKAILTVDTAFTPVGKFVFAGD